MAESNKTAAATLYVILERADGEEWVQLDTIVEAPSATQAIRRHLKGAVDVDAEYVAVPSRSWCPVKVKTRVALDFGGAT